MEKKSTLEGLYEEGDTAGGLLWQHQRECLTVQGRNGILGDKLLPW